MEEGWARLGERITQERSRRWRTRAEFARVVGLSKRTLDDLETGRRSRYAPRTLSAVEVALGWAPGTCERIAQGGRVRREADANLTRVLDAWPRLDEDARSLLGYLVQVVMEDKRGR